MSKWPLLLLLLSFSCYAHDPDCGHRRVNVTGTGEVKASPDQVVVQMNIETRHKTAASAREEIEARVNRFLAAIEPLKLARQDIVAAALNISPQYEYRDSQRFFSGYLASRPVTVTLRQLRQLDQLLDLAVNNGVNQVLSLTPESSKAAEHQLQAHKNAIADSQTKGQQLAAAYGAELGPVYSIDYRETSLPYSTQAEVASFRLQADAAGGQYLQDQLTYTDTVQVVFDLIIPQ